ncbi:MAG TPA: CHAT domain-containing protein, partial [Kofleriaceae bacterium]|nr:CHAT domain-containing protein [Kofleriaceae bacterium]
MITTKKGRFARLAARLAPAILLAATSGGTQAAPRGSPCRQAMARGGAAAVDVCRDAYRRSGRDDDGILLAHAYLLAGDSEQVLAVTRGMVDRERASDARRERCRALLDDDQATAGLLEGIAAYAIDTAAGDRRRMGQDALCVSQAARHAGQPGEALAAADAAIALAHGAGDQATELPADIAAVDALRRMGATGEASGAMRAAVGLARTPCEQVWAHLKLGMLLQESDDETTAGDELDQADEANHACDDGRARAAIQLNRAALLTRAAPAKASALLDDVARDGGDGPELLLLRALIEGNLGHDLRAAQLLDRAAHLPQPDADWLWMIEDAQADLDAAAGDVVGAEEHYRRSIARVGELRLAAEDRSALVLASHRLPYEGLMILLAEQDRWRELLALVLDLDASDMLEAAGAPAAAREATAPADAAAVSVDDVIGAWRGRDLVIVLAPGARLIGSEPEPVLRLRLVDGALTGERLGPASPVRAAARTLFGHPDAAAEGRALGRVFVPDDGRTGTLDVLAIGALGRVPLAALRDATGTTVVARRPLDHMLSIRPRAAAPPASGPPLVIADPTGELPDARIEGWLVAAMLGAPRAVAGAGGAPAVRARLGDARHATVLHIAGHVVQRGRWRVLPLADGEVGPDDVIALGLAPRLAVLASCASALARDEDGWGSIPAAMITSGADTVIATDRTLDDDVALRLVMRLYARPGWTDDPTRALAAL